MRNKIDEWWWLAIIALMACIVLLSSCKVCEPIKQIEYRDSIRTEYLRDSIYERDSIYIDRWRENDTVWITKTIDRFIYRDKVKTDTVTIDNSKHETVQVKVVPQFYKTCTIGFWCFVLLVLIVVVWKVSKLFR